MIQQPRPNISQPHGKTTVWDSKMVDDVRAKIIRGETIFGGNPFHEGNIEFRAGDIIYDYSDEER